MKDYTEDYAAVVSIMPVRDRLILLAEECSELAQSALKVERTLPSSMYPTPVRCEDAMAKMYEEFGDVLMCADLLGLTNPGQPLSMSNPKWERCRRRMEEKFPQPPQHITRKLHDPDEAALRCVATCPPEGWPE